MALSSFR
jgi:hypothetical protein